MNSTSYCDTKDKTISKIDDMPDNIDNENITSISYNNIINSTPKRELNDDSIIYNNMEHNVETIEQDGTNCSRLTTAVDHPLMTNRSPEVENYPDIITETKNSVKKYELNEIGLKLYERQVNSSKNNLFFNENFEKQSPPDVTKVDKHRNRSCVELSGDRSVHGPSLNRTDDNVTVGKFDLSIPLDISNAHSFQSESEMFPDSPSQLSSLSNFVFPLETCAARQLVSVYNHNDVKSPCSPHDKSLYEALIDPYRCSVSLTTTTRRTIKAINVQNTLDYSDRSLSACSLNSDEIYQDNNDRLEATVRSISQEPDRTVHTDDEDSYNRASVSEYSEPIPEYTAAEERYNERSWLKVTLNNGDTKTVDMKVIEPYKRVLSHGGYSHVGAAVIVFSACYLPDSDRPDYNYVMDNLLYYILWTLERLVTDDYVLVYLHGSAERHKLPSFRWLTRSYQLINRRLRKSLKHLYLVHPTFWLKSVMWMSKPFISTKLYKKLTYVRKLSDLMNTVPIEPASIPDKVIHYDQNIVN